MLQRSLKYPINLASILRMPRTAICNALTIVSRASSVKFFNVSIAPDILKSVKACEMLCDRVVKLVLTIVVAVLNSLLATFFRSESFEWSTSMCKYTSVSAKVQSLPVSTEESVVAPPFFKRSVTHLTPVLSVIDCLPGSAAESFDLLRSADWPARIVVFSESKRLFRLISSASPTKAKFFLTRPLCSRFDPLPALHRSRNH